MKTIMRITGLLLVLTICAGRSAPAQDWPMWRGDIQRSASTPAALAEDLHLQWTLELAPPEACWPWEQFRIQFDVSYEPVAAEGLLFVPSMVTDSVAAHHADSGGRKWLFQTDGPVRFAPLYHEGRVYVVSDDGYLYCLQADDGALVWKFRGGPSNHRLLGNSRLISLWPARGAPVIDEEGVLYFAAGIWPFMGIFIHALDAASGEVVWTNSGSGADYILQPHNTPAFAGVAPQGFMTLHGDTLLVAGGRSVPAAYDRRTGAFEYFRTDTKRGFHSVLLGGDYYFNDGIMYRVSDGRNVLSADPEVIDGDRFISTDSRGRIAAFSVEPVEREVVDRRGESSTQLALNRLWRLGEADEAVGRVFLKAGDHLYAGSPDGRIQAIAIPDEGTDGAAPDVTWQARIDGTPWSMLASEGRLFVVTEEGAIHCFGPASRSRSAVHGHPRRAELDRDLYASRMAGAILSATDVREGYCLVVGVGTGKLAEELRRQSDLNIIAIDPDPERVAALRRRWIDSGLYGERLSLVAGDVQRLRLPRYLASLVVSEDLDAAGLLDGDRLARLYPTLRPYGGVVCLPLEAEGRRFAEAPPLAGRHLLGDDEAQAFLALADGPGLVSARASRGAGFARLERHGALPGSSPWTHHNADAANTVCSTDDLVRPPLGLLWFGGPSHMDIFPRHGHGPRQLVAGGRLIIQGVGVLSARDVYTGRVLWRREMPHIDTFGMYYDESFNPDPFDRSYNQLHIPGANALGANFAISEDTIYITSGAICEVMDIATGETLHQWRLPSMPDVAEPNWGVILLHRDYLIAATAPFGIESRNEDEEDVDFRPNEPYAVGSRYLMALDRFTGELRWARKAQYNFRHNSVIAAGDRLYCIDGMSGQRMDLMARRGLIVAGKPTLYALDLATGDEIWETSEEINGTWLGYSQQHDILLHAGSRARDRARDETARGMRAYRGATGEVLWDSDRRYFGPCIIHHDTLITQTEGGTRTATPARAYCLLTGELRMEPHPLTGEPIPWEWVRFYGCNTAIGGEHIMTFRSAAAAFTDIRSGQGVATIGGFKSGCTSNLVPADGVLNAPDYTRTCTCSYQNQTCLALAHMPENDPDSPVIEEWGYYHLVAPDQPTAVQKVGINFAAPGDRQDDEGVLWMEYPSVGGPSPDLPVHVRLAEGGGLRRYHGSQVEVGPGPRWVAASAVEGALAVTLRPFLQPAPEDADARVAGYERHVFTNQIPDDPPEAEGAFDEERQCRVRLVFCELDDVEEGERVFDIAIQGQTVARGFDIVAEAGGARRSVIREFGPVPIRDVLEITLTPNGAGIGGGNGGEGGGVGAGRPPIISGLEYVLLEP